jgi:diguanylate cyclase (GGDEF)-like protein
LNVRIVSPGVVVRDLPPLESGREGRLATGRLIGRVAILGWLCTVTTVVLSGHHAPAGPNALIVAGLGVCFGVVWTRMRWDRRPMRAIHFQLAMATLMAGAALIALDEQVIASVPFFCALAAVAGLATEGRITGFAHIFLAVATLLLAGLLAPGRMAGASGHAISGALAIFAIGTMTMVFRERHEAREKVLVALADRDQLTGVANYRRLHDSLVNVVATEPERFALLTLDLDHFRALNQRYGQLEGDRLLREIGRMLIDTTRGQDVVARNGGDEFTVLAPETGKDGAALLAERIERALARIEAIDHGHVEASIGIAVYPEDGRTADELLAKADLDLHLAKQRRRIAVRDVASAALSA